MEGQIDRQIDRQTQKTQTKSPQSLLSLASKNTVIFHICIYRGIVTSARDVVARNSCVVAQSCWSWVWATEVMLEHICWLASSQASSEMAVMAAFKTLG